MSESEFETHSIPEENGNGSVHSEEKLNNREQSENRENRENNHHNEADDCVLETDSNGSMEDTMAKLEHALKKNFERFEDLQEICENGNGCEEVKDVTQLEGYQPIPEECPAWKRAMIERKNKQLVESYMKHIDDQRREEQRWEGVPAWKKSLMQDKEKKKYDDVAPQEEEKRKRQEEEIRFQSMPEWKRHLLLKKRGDM